MAATAPKTDTRERILASARDLFLDGGLPAVRMRQVAHRAGVSAMAAYRHFANKEELLQQVVDAGFAVFMDYLQASLTEPTPWRRLSAAGAAYLEFALAHPRDYEVMFMQPRGAGVPAGHSHGWRDAATFRFLVERIAECQNDGSLAPGDPEDLALTVWAAVHGLVSLHLTGTLGLDESDFRQHYAAGTGRVLAGLLPAAGGPPGSEGDPAPTSNRS